jgi:hypothetical protein
VLFLTGRKKKMKEMFGGVDFLTIFAEKIINQKK